MLMAERGRGSLRYTLEEVDLIKRLRKDNPTDKWSVITEKYNGAVSKARFRSREAVVEKWKMLNGRRSKRRWRANVRVQKHGLLGV